MELSNGEAWTAVHGMVRGSIFLCGLFVLAFATAAVAGLMGAFITRAAPVL